MNKHDLSTTITPKDLRIGSRVMLFEKEWEITETRTEPCEHIRFREVRGSMTFELSPESIQQHWEREDLLITRHVQCADSYLIKINDLTSTEKRNYERKCAAVKLMHELQGFRASYIEMKFNEFCRKQNNEYLDRYQVKPKAAQKIQTLRKWQHQYIKSGGTHCFIQKDHRPRYRGGRFSEEIESLMRKAIDIAYARRERPDMSSAYYFLIGLASEKLCCSMTEAKRRVPSKKTFIRRIKSFDQYYIDKKREGEYAVRDLYGYSGKKIEPERIGEIVEVDSHTFDTFVYDELTGYTYRPFLLLMIDVYSRCIIGWDLSITAPSAKKVLRVLQRSITKDDYTYRIIPELIVVDNGSEFINSSLADQCSSLNIRIKFSPPKEPKSKAYVERFFREVSKKLGQKLPGSTSSNTKEKGDYKSQEEATLTTNELNDLFCLYLESEHKKFHRGCNDIPNGLWLKSSTSSPESTPNTLTPEESFFLGCKIDHVNINDESRVTFKNLQWVSSSLHTIKRRFDAKNKKTDRPYEILYNEDDLQYVYVRDPKSPQNLIQCDPVEPRYQTGLTMDVHKLVIEERNKKMNDNEWNEDWLTCRIKLERAIIETQDESRKTKRKKAELEASARKSASANTASEDEHHLMDKSLSGSYESFMKKIPNRKF